MNMIKLVLPALLVLTVPTVSATHGDATGQVLLSEGSHTSISHNSVNMKSARKFCALAVHKEYVEKKVSDPKLVTLVAECAKGNLNHVFSELGGNHYGPEDALHSIFPVIGGAAGVRASDLRHTSKWEADVLKANHNMEHALKHADTLQTK
jgi:hypothetical protein